MPAQAETTSFLRPRREEHLYIQVSPFYGTLPLPMETGESTSGSDPEDRPESTLSSNPRGEERDPSLGPHADAVNPRRRILLIDDHALVRDGMAQIIEADPNVFIGGQAATAAEGEALALQERWDLVILDLSLPDGAGLDLLKSVRAAKPDLPILVVSMFDEHQYGPRCLRVGASGYLTKAAAGRQLLDAVQTVLSGERYVSANLAQRLAQGPNRPPSTKDAASLSDREHEVLCALAAGESVSEIGARFDLSVKTISTYRRRAMQKLGLKSTADLVRHAIENDLTLAR